MVPLMGSPTAVRATALATASAAMGWMNARERQTVWPSVAESAMPLTNSKNWVACDRIGDADSLINTSLYQLRSEVTAFLQTFGADDGQRNMMAHISCLLGCKGLPVEVVKEIEHRLVVERW